jgi:hypothetical protein
MKAFADTAEVLKKWPGPIYTLSYTAVLEEAVYSLIMKFGNL